MPKVIYSKNFAEEGSKFIIERIQEVLSKESACVIALAGGTTPIGIYNILSVSSLPWRKIYLALGDERFVHKESSESNYKGVFDALISNIDIPEENIIRIKTELGFQESAREYAEDLKCLKKNLGRDYIFDIVLLGIGSDGHTASLFPKSSGLSVNDRLVTTNIVDNKLGERITLTYPAINSSKEIIFLVNDKSKTEVMNKILAGEDYPATHVKNDPQNITWIVG